MGNSKKYDTFVENASNMAICTSWKRIYEIY